MTATGRRLVIAFTTVATAQLILAADIIVPRADASALASLSWD
jgi:hypothetical protein